jgi:hypothetical protein
MGAVLKRTVPGVSGSFRTVSTSSRSRSMHRWALTHRKFLSYCQERQ